MDNKKHTKKTQNKVKYDTTDNITHNIKYKGYMHSKIHIQ